MIKRFGGQAAVDGLSFTVEAGEILGLVGPNGAGKTTMFDCLAGSQRPTSGRILFAGRPSSISRPTPAWRSDSAGRSRSPGPSAP